MKNRKTALTAVLTLVLSVTALTGCGQTTGAGGTPSPNAGNVSQSPSPSQSNPIPENLTLTWYQQNHASSELNNMGDIKGIQAIEEATGIQMTFQHPATGTNGNEQLNLIIASNQLPDIILWDWASMPGGISKYISSKTVIPVDALAAEYAPHYIAALEKYPEVKKASMLDDGTLPGFYGLDPDPKRTSYQGFVLRGDWLEKLSLDVPVTIEDWHTVLTAFKTGDPNGNQQADEIPFSQTKGTSYASFSGAFGILNGMYRDPAGGKVKYGPVEEGYKQFIATLAQWYNEGLIDPDFATNDSNAFSAKLQGNLAGSSFITVGGGIGNNTKAARANNPDFLLEPVAAPLASDGKSYATTVNAVQKTTGLAVITSSCKYPEAAAAFMDYAYSEEGHTLINFGIESESYTLENGKAVFTQEILNNPQGKTPVNAAYTYALPITGWAKIMDYDAYSQINLILDEQKRSAEVWSKADNSLVITNAIQYTTDESSELSRIMSDINTYVAQEELKFILGAEPLGNLDSFVEKIKAMNIDRAIEINQAALDRFESRN